VQVAYLQKKGVQPVGRFALRILSKKAINSDSPGLSYTQGALAQYIARLWQDDCNETKNLLWQPFKQFLNVRFRHDSATLMHRSPETKN